MGVAQPKLYGIGSKVNQFIYTLVCNYMYMPAIRILAKAVLKIFCSQGGGGRGGRERGGDINLKVDLNFWYCFQRCKMDLDFWFVFKGI